MTLHFSGLTKLFSAIQANVVTISHFSQIQRMFLIRIMNMNAAIVS